MKKSLSLFLALLLLCTGLIPCASAESPVQWGSRAIFTNNIYLSTPGPTTLSITFTCVGTGLCSQLGVASFYVERQDDNGNWYIVAGPYAGETGTDVVSYSFGRYYYGTPGVTYRVTATFYSTLNGVTDTSFATSAAVTLPKN